MVYVISIDGQPLMPTNRHGAVCRWLKSGKAKAVRTKPFTIQLLFKTGNKTQPIRLGVDTGGKFIGVSAVSKSKLANGKVRRRELFSAEIKMRMGISKLLSTRRMYRRNKRNRLRYREPRFLNRVRTKIKGWLAPSVQHKLDTHVKVVEFVKTILPITKVIVEAAAFDIQKIKNPDIQGKGYQQGEQLGFWNVREYVLCRDKHVCQYCKKRNLILQVHHIKPRKKDGADRPANLITLCVGCHKKLHAGKIQLKKQPAKSFRMETLMSIIRWKIVNALKSKVTYGYITKSRRIKHKIEKSHVNDAFVIAGGTRKTKRCEAFNVIQKRKNNRCLQTNRKGYKPSIRRQRYALRPWDIVKVNGVKWFVKGVCGRGTRINLKNNKKETLGLGVKKLDEYVFHQKGLVFI